MTILLRHAAALPSPPLTLGTANGFSRPSRVSVPTTGAISRSAKPQIGRRYAASAAADRLETSSGTEVGGREPALEIPPAHTQFSGLFGDAEGIRRVQCLQQGEGAGRPRRDPTSIQNAYKGASSCN